jgi:rSAM/selenodomain-associated transferase 1
MTAVIMVKRPEPGAVKTRLVEPGGVSASVAADIARAMLACIARRLDRIMPVVLAVTPDGCGRDLAHALSLSHLPTVDQGSGDLGERLDRVWRTQDPHEPIAFFGCDSPDVPIDAIEAIVPALRDHDVAIGPTLDGGYWTLAASRYLPALLDQIDWGGENVYDQTLARARDAALRVHRLPEWVDVDRAVDVLALHQRLIRMLDAEAGGDTVDPDLVTLGNRLGDLLRGIRREEHG